MKRYLLQESGQYEKNLSNVLDAFTRTKSLYNFRKEFRGYMGLPRIRSTDNNLSEILMTPKKIRYSKNISLGSINYSVNE